MEQADRIGGGPPRLANGDEVRQHELEQIAVRRREAFGCPAAAGSQSPEQNLVGLALSGGGIRSGAFSLGMLQALHRRGVLPFIDYLSTVSGGGYAGAFLSSVALKRTRTQRRGTGNGAAPGAGAADAADGLFPIASARPPRASERMLRFIHGGNYLAHWWKFFNRYLIGLVLILAVVVSGLLAIASLTAWLFRSLDHVEMRDWLAALGFRDDLTLTFFPTFVLFWLWLGCWTLSYLKFAGRAVGTVARLLFYALVFVTLTAVAVLLVTGNISTEGLRFAWGRKPDEKAVDSITSTIGLALLAGIGVALLPYLSPKRLFHSGTNPRNAVEKYGFWIASRALVFGVPFLVIAFFAREDISHWNALRDDRLALTDVAGYTQVWPPLFRQIYAEGSRSDAKPSTPGEYLWRGTDGDGVSLRKWFRALAALEPQLHESELGIGELAEPGNPARAERSLTDADHDLTFRARWANLLAMPAEALFHPRGIEDNPLWAIVKHRRQQRWLKREIMSIVNCRLLDPTFYKLFDPARLQALYPDRPAEFWNGLSQLRAEAEQLLATQSLERDPGNGGCSACLASVQLPSRLATIHHRPENEHPQFPLDGSAAAGAAGPSQSEARRRILAEEQRQRAVLSINRRLLAALYGDSLQPKTRVTSYVTLGKDQETRLTWFWWSLGIFLLASLLVDLNATSLHGFYAGQINDTWTEEAPGLGRDIPLAQLETVEVGRPYHLITGSLHLVGPRQRGPGQETNLGQFLFSRLYCGSGRLGGYARTEEWMGGTYRLSDAVAVSGGAVSPTQILNPLVAVLLVLANVRLGQWVANPAYSCRSVWGRLLWRSWPVTPSRILVRLAQAAERRPYVFVADGGHRENLGIEPLLKRRCRLIMASDAGMDKEYRFADLMRLMRWARIMHGIEFVTADAREKLIALEDLIPSDPDRRSRSHYAIVKIKYPDDGRPGPADHTGYLVYVKSSLRGDEPLDLLRYRDRNPDFPHDSTADQFFDPERFESYRQLGEKIGLSLCERLPAEFPQPGLATDVDEFISQFIGTIDAHGIAPFVIDTESPDVRAFIATSETHTIPPVEEQAVGIAGNGQSPTVDGAYERSLALLRNPAAASEDREWAAVEIGRLGRATPEAIDALLSAAIGNDHFVSKSAAHALSLLGLDAVALLHERGLSDPEPLVKAAAAGAIEEIFQGQNALARRCPERALERAVDSVLIDGLTALLGAEHPTRLRTAAAYALAEYAPWIAPAAAPELMARIRRSVKDLKTGKRSRALRIAAEQVERRLATLN